MTPVKYLSSEDAARHLGFVHADGSPNRKAFKTFVRNQKPKAYRIGRRLRFRVVDLDACVEVRNEQGEAQS